MAFRDIDNINEADIDISGKSAHSEDNVKLYAKNQLVFNKLRDYWMPLYKQGKLCMNFMHGQIFDDETKRQYEEVQNKLCIEPRIMKSRMNSLAGHITQGERKGRVISEGGISAEEDYVANVILKQIDQSIDLGYILKQAVLTGITTAFPQVFEYDLCYDPLGDIEGGLNLEWVKWDRIVVSPEFMQPNGKDIREYIKFSRKTISELIRENPEKEDEINSLYEDIKDRKSLTNTLEGSAIMTIEDIRNLDIDLGDGAARSRADGRLLVYDRVFPVLKTVEAFVSKVPQSDVSVDFQRIPSNWSVSRKQKWIKKNPQYQYIKTEIPVLWHSRWTREGLVLKNEEHWFQEHDRHGMPELPIATFVPQIIDGMPTAPGPDNIPLVQMKAIAETEFLHDIRTGSGDILAYVNGAVKNAEDLPTELSISNGIINLDESKVNGSIDNYVRFLKRNPNTSYGEYAQKVEGELDKTDLISKAIQGQHVPTQSGTAKELEISQAMIGYHLIISNYNSTYERLKNLQCMMIPYAFAEEHTVQIWDDERQEHTQPITVNKMEYDINGSPQIVENDLTAAKWRWKLVDAEDSATAREAELNEMLLFWNTAAPPLIQADSSLGMLSSVLMSMSNKMAKEVGKVIAEKSNAQAEQLGQQEMMQMMAEIEEKKSSAQADLIKAQRSGFQFSITAEDLVKFPELYQMLVSSNYINTADNNQFQLPQAAGSVNSQEVANAG